MKKNLSIRICSIFLSLLMVVTILPLGAFTASAASFTPRTTAPSYNDKWYRDYHSASSPSCVSYVKARASEILGRPYDSYLASSGNYGGTNWWNTTTKLKRGSKPQAGAIMCWSGHVAVVEKVNGDYIEFSEANSYYRATTGGTTKNVVLGTNSGTYFDYRFNIRYDKTTGKPSGGSSSSWLGYIYLIDSNYSGTDLEEYVPPTNDNHYNANAKYSNGIYKNTCNSGVNMRSSVGVQTNNKIGCTVPNNAEVNVYETNGNWGKITYAGKTGWVCLDYFTKVSIPVPATPTISSISSDNIAVGKNITINWNAVSGAASYTVGIRSAHVNQDINVGNATSYNYLLSYAEKYEFYVKASNVSGSSGWSSAKSCTAHNPVTVSFVDWNNTPLGSQTIEYGSNATAPSAPPRKGYTFQGWNDSFYNVKSDKTIKATYKINTYTVNFFDKDGVLIESQKVTYGNDAIPPKDTHEDSKYKFLGWNSTDYIDVYTDRTDKNINIDGVYSWYNYDLPTICTIKSATRQYDGYYVTFDIENNDSVPTTGRAVVALKTADGKLVDMTESTAFSIPAGKTKNGFEVFIPCNKVASSIEVFMVADYSSGVPISPSVKTTIKEGLMYAESTVKPNNSDGTLDVQEITQYSYRDKEFSTGNTKTKDGWTWDGTKTEQAGNWSGWQDNVISGYTNESVKREVSTQTATTYSSKPQYNYYRYAANYSGGYSSEGWQNDKQNAYFYTFDSELVYGGTSSRGTPWYKWYYNGSNYCAVYRCGTGYNTGGTFITYKQVASGTKTQYRYRDINYIYNFYRWKTWSDWSDTQVSSSNNRDVRTRTIYRYVSNNVLPEDTSGKVRTINGKLDSSFAGKQITLYVYGYTGASDYTNQYIGQSVVAKDGSYSFTFKLREEPTAKTGDFTVAIGIEGTTNTTIIDTIEAPKPTYSVKFYDWDGSVISTQTVKEGASAVLPKNPTKEGYNFIGWDKSVANIKEDTEFFADFERKQYTVVFVDWENQQIEVKQFNHGDALVAPEVKAIDGYTFTGWDNVSAVVTQNMVVTAQYEANQYTIKFYDWNNKVIDSQTVKYGETAVVPDDPSEKGVNFVDWLNFTDYQYVQHDAAIYPLYYYDETTDMPMANYYTGEYNNKIQLELSSNDKNAEIYYYLNDDETSEQIYTGPITIDKTCSVTYYATSAGKNNSETATEYYCINADNNKNYHIVYVNLYDTVLLVEEGKTIDITGLDNIEGYDLKGLYTNEELTNKFDLSTPVTQSLTLYTLYSPKKYTVTFKKADGTKIDVQSVEYMQSATAPTVEKVPGYVFAGWDKTFDCITEDMVITGKYVKDSDHTNTEIKNKKSATCTANGYTGDTYCKDCGALLESGKTTNATGHSYDSGKVTKAATCSATGVKTYTCTKCKATKTETIAKTAHSYDSGKVTKAATTTATGVKTYTCTKCKATKTETIPKLPAKLSAPTLKVTVNTSGTFTLSWNKITDAEKYEIYSKQADGSYTLLKTVTGTSYTTVVGEYGKQYSYKMKAVKGSTKSDYSNVVNATNNKKLQTPTLKVAVNSNGTFKMTWNKVTGATSYQIYYKQTDGSYKLLKTVTGTSYTSGFAQYGKQYSYKMKAVTSKNSSATSAYSSVVNATNNKKLQTPTLKVAVNSNGTFKMTWNKVTGATSYQIYYKQADGSYKLLKTVTGTSYTSGFAQYGKQYSYKMKAVTSKNSSATSAYSSVVNATNNKKLQTPTLKVSVNSNGTFKMTWNKVTGATSYQIYYKQSDGSYKLLKTVTGTSYISGFAQYGKQYSYKVRAVTSKNSSATSNYSSVVNAKNTKKLGTPTMKATVNKNGSFKLSWGKVTGATSYQIYWKQANGSYKLLKTVTGTSYTTVVAAKGKTYNYKVRAVTKNNSSAASNYSSVVSAKRK